MYEEVLTNHALRLFPNLSAFKDDFYLAGGNKVEAICVLEILRTEQSHTACTEPLKIIQF